MVERRDSPGLIPRSLSLHMGMHMPQMSQRRSAALTLLLIGLLGCHDATAPAACDGKLDVLVSPGETPTISWSPNCGISELLVFKEPAPFTAGEIESVVWGFMVSELAPIRPVVRYGDAPRGANVMKAPETLRPGAEYRILVMYTVGGDGVSAMGERIFVP
jgi:hypothetical protein